MKRVVATIAMVLILLGITSAQAEVYDAYPGIYPYDTIGALQQEQLDAFAKLNQTIYDGCGVRLVAYIVRSCDGLSVEEYGNIVYRIRESVVGDMEMEVFMLADNETRAIHTIIGKDVEAFLSASESDAALEEVKSEAGENIYNDLVSFYQKIAGVIINNASAQPSSAEEQSNTATTYDLDGFLVTISGCSLSDSYAGLTLNINVVIENNTSETLYLIPSEVSVNGWVINNVGCAAQVPSGKKMNATIYLNGIDKDAQVSSVEDLKKVEMVISASNSSFQPVSSKAVTITLNP